MFCNSSSRPAFNSSSGNFPLSAVRSRLRSTVGTSHKKLLTAAILPANELSFALDPCPDSLLWRGGRKTWGRSRERQGRGRSNNHVHMHGWDEVKWHGRGPWANVTYEHMYDNTSKRHAHRAQWCAVVTSVWVMALMQLVTVVSGLFRLCMKLYTMFP